MHRNLYELMMWVAVSLVHKHWIIPSYLIHSDNQLRVDDPIISIHNFPAS
jgi:hypothetical protein